MKKKLFPLLALLLVVLAAFIGCAELPEDILLPTDPLSGILETIDDTTEPQTEEQTVLLETQPETEPATEPETEAETEALLDPDGSYTTKEDVALYIYTYGELPSNFMTKKEARALGWEGGGLDGYADGMCIGGDRFGNYEGILPDADGRKWTECDIDTLHAKSRGAKRIVFSNDGLVYYTDDHYESFELLYGEP